MVRRDVVRTLLSGVASMGLSQACDDGDLGKVKELLVGGNEDINNTETDDETPLHKACAGGFVEIVEVRPRLHPRSLPREPCRRPPRLP